jgi:hypothetical protein
MSFLVSRKLTSVGVVRAGGKHFRYRRGYKNVIGKGVELNEAGESCELMMETRSASLRSPTFMSSYIAVLQIRACLSGRLIDAFAMRLINSGHGAMKENFFLDDGAYSAVKTIIQLVRLRLAGEGSISEMLDQLDEPLESREFRLAIKVQYS